MCKNEIKKEIDEISLAIRVRDAFATPAPITYIPTDPAQLIIDEKKRRMISYFAGYDAAELSDYELFELIGRKRGFLISGGEINTERTAITLMDEFRGCKIGRITLDRYSKEELPDA